MINEAKRATIESMIDNAANSIPNAQDATITNQPRTTGYMQQVGRGIRRPGAVPFKSMADYGAEPVYTNALEAATGQVQYPSASTLPPFLHVPFTLEWNGSKYVPDFIPDHIRVTAFHYKDYQELKNAYRKEKSRASQVPELKTVIDGLLKVQDSLIKDIERQALQLRAYAIVWSAREYLKVTQPLDYAAYALLTHALGDLITDQADWQNIKAKYKGYDATGRCIEQITAIEYHTEDRSI